MPCGRGKREREGVEESRQKFAHPFKALAARLRTRNPSRLARACGPRLFMIIDTDRSGWIDLDVAGLGSALGDGPVNDLIHAYFRLLHKVEL